MNVEVYDARHYTCPFCHGKTQLLVLRGFWVEAYVLHDCPITRKPTVMPRTPHEPDVFEALGYVASPIIGKL